MQHKTRWPIVRALKMYRGTAAYSPDDFLARFNWSAVGSEPDFNLSEVDAIYAEIISKIPAEATKVLEIGYGDGRFYQALKAARPALDYVGIDLVIENFIEAQTAKGTITVDAVQSGDTVTIEGVTLTASGSQTPGGLDFDATITPATATVTVASVQAGDTVTVGGVVLTASGSQGPGGLDFDETAGSDVLVADSLVAAINDAGNGLNAICTADNAGGTSAVVTLTAVDLGVGGNYKIGLGSSTEARLATSNTGLTGGVGSNVTVADSLVAAINDAGNGLNGVVRASNQGRATRLPVVTIRAASRGEAGNLLALASSTGGRLAVSGATLAGGVDPGVFNLGNAAEYLKESTDGWDFVVSINTLFSCTDERLRDILFDLLDTGAAKGFIVVADPLQAEASWLTPRMGAAVAESSGVVESYSEGARTFLTDATLKSEMQPFWMVRSSTAKAVPTDPLPSRHRFVENGAFNFIIAIQILKYILRNRIGDPLPTQFTGITRSGGLITGTATIDIDPEWTEGLGG